MFFSFQTFVNLDYRLSHTINNRQIYLLLHITSVLQCKTCCGLPEVYISTQNLYYKCNIIKVSLFLSIFAFVLEMLGCQYMCLQFKLEGNNMAMNFQKNAYSLKMAFHYIKPHFAKKRSYVYIHKTCKALQLMKRNS